MERNEICPDYNDIIAINYRVCVLCCTFNHAQFIVQAMDGFCMQQTSFPFVCCIIDDCSTDGEQAIIADYLKKNFSKDDNLYKKQDSEIAEIVFAHHRTNNNCYFVTVSLKKNLYGDPDGYYKKLNIISEWRDKCEYEAMCEGDDYWTDESKLQVQVDFLDRHLDYSVCSHRIRKYDHDSGTYYVDRFGGMFLNKDGVTFGNRTKVWLSETSSIVFRVNSQRAFSESPCPKRDNVNMYFLLKTGKGFCFSRVMSVYRQHRGGVFSKQDLETRLINGSYKALKQLYEYEQTTESRYLYYRTYALTFLLTKGRIVRKERFDLLKFLSLPLFIISIIMCVHPAYKKDRLAVVKPGKAK